MDKNRKVKGLLLLLVRVFVGGLFIYAGVAKIISPSDFLNTVQGYQLLPYHAGAIVAVYLPWLELLCGGSLLIGVLSRGALLNLFILLTIFAGAIVSAWAKGIQLVSCGCFGVQSTEVNYPCHILEILLLALMVGVLAVHGSSKTRKQPIK